MMFVRKLNIRARSGWLLLCALACAPLRPEEPPEPPIATGSPHRSPGRELPQPLPSGSARAAPAPALAVEYGKATYYSDRLAGRSTASGEAYAPLRFTAAHKKLPFGSRVRVVRTDTGHHVTVTVNDRGPFAGADRIIDLSRVAAERLHMLRAGVVPVRIEVLQFGQGRRKR